MHASISHCVKSPRPKKLAGTAAGTSSTACPLFASNTLSLPPHHLLRLHGAGGHRSPCKGGEPGLASQTYFSLSPSSAHHRRFEHLQSVFAFRSIQDDSGKPGTEISMYKPEGEFAAVPNSPLPALVVSGGRHWGHTIGKILLVTTVRIIHAGHNCLSYPVQTEFPLDAPPKGIWLNLRHHHSC